jgi:hypothetical protein
VLGVGHGDLVGGDAMIRAQLTLLAQASRTADDPRSSCWPTTRSGCVLIKVVALFAVGVVLTLFMINWERKVVGRMQQRPGPNRVGPAAGCRASPTG